MTIREVTDSDFPQLQEFLSPRESTCVTLCANVRKKKLEKIFVITSGLSTPSTGSGTVGTAESGVPEALEGPSLKGLS